jgi:hypothetical protein
MSTEPLTSVSGTATTDTSDRGLLIAVLLMVVLGTTAMLFVI